MSASPDLAIGKPVRRSEDAVDDGARLENPFGRDPVGFEKGDGLVEETVTFPTVSVDRHDRHGHAETLGEGSADPEGAVRRAAAVVGGQDTADRLDYDKMAQVVDGIYSYVKHLANG